MSDKFVLNMIGEPCPIPVVKARRALENNEAVIVTVDNIIAVQNLKKMADGLKYTYSYTEISKDIFEVAIGGGKVGGVASPAIISENLLPQRITPSDEETRGGHDRSASGFVVAIGSDRMGVGAVADGTCCEDSKLGKILMKGYIYSLTELDQLPSTVIFLNSGAYLTADGSNTVDDLKILESKDVRIMTCGTCSNYYALQDKLAVGEIVDMYEISSQMANASKVINI